MGQRYTRGIVSLADTLDLETSMKSSSRN